MFSEELKRVDRRLKRIVRSGRLKDKTVYLFGAGSNMRQITDILRRLGVEPYYILDNDPAKQNSYFAQIRVIPVEEVQREEKDYVVLLYSLFQKEMAAQLQKMGVPKKKILRLRKKNKLAAQLVSGMAGSLVYRRLVSKYGDLPVYLCPYTGTGDVYLVGAFWKQFLEAEHVKEYVFCVISGACRKVANLFDIQNIEQLTENESDRLVKYYSLCSGKIQLKILNDGWAPIRTNSMEWFRGYKGLGFTEMFQKFVFDLPDTCRPVPPCLPDVESMLHPLFEENRLEVGRTVLLSPYSNTLADLPEHFWENLAVQLRQAGYVVCTNCKGDKTDPAVKGTVPVFFPLNIAPQFVSKAGYFIGVRSGLCDTISAANAKKIILYDKQDRFYNCDAFSYFSLERMGLCSDAAEIVFDPNTNDLLDQIMFEMRKGEK